MPSYDPLHQYATLALFAGLSVVFVVGGLVSSILVRPKKPTEVKLSTYECGVKVQNESWIQFKIQYYLYALLFVVFDVESVFFYPWAVQYRALGWYGVIEMLVFLFILLVGLAYAWRKKALEWK